LGIGLAGQVADAVVAVAGDIFLIVEQVALTLGSSLRLTFLLFTGKYNLSHDC
jgi:hypothetical protein